MLGLGVIGSFVGRNVLLGAFALTFFGMGMYLETLLLSGWMLIDMIIHFEVLLALRRLMSFDVITELSRGMT